MFTAEVNHLQMAAAPLLLRENLFQVALRLLHIFATGQPPARGEAVNVGIHGKSGLAKGLVHDHGGCFVAHAGQFFERVEGGGDTAVVFAQ